MQQIPSESPRVEQEVNTLLGAKRSLQAELRNAPSSQKQFLAEMIRDVNSELNSKQDEFGQFMEDYSLERRALVDMPFVAAFEGTVVVEIDDDDFRGPHEVEFTPEGVGDTARMRVKFDHTSVEVVDLPPIEMDEEETEYGPNTTTVRRITNEGRTEGSFDEASGHIELPLDLFFENSLGQRGVETDAPANFDLTTRGVSAPVGDYSHVDLDGVPLDPESMEFKAVAESTFEDISGWYEISILGGKDVVLSAEGKLSDISGPPLDVPSSLSFGQVVVGDVRTRTIPIKNTTGSNVMLTIPDSPKPPTGPGAPGIATFSWHPTGTQLLRRGEEMNVTVSFAPAANEQAQMTMTITGNDSGSPHSVTLRGTGIGVPGPGNGENGPVRPP